MSHDEYKIRFSRNEGILTIEEQERLAGHSVAVAGVGGLGGHSLVNLARMGVGRFSIADIDLFDVSNTNRQIGASAQSMGKSKVEVMGEMVRDINPDATVTEFTEGISAETVDTFVQSCDIVVDSLDFFCLTARAMLYESCRRHRKTVILSAPLGFSATLHVFSPSSMSYERYFDWKPGMDNFDRMIHFAVGIAPLGLHTKYLNFDKESLVRKRTGPSIATGCTLGGTLVATEVLIALLQRRPLFQAPFFTQVDPYIGVYRRRKLHFGNRGPLQRLKIYLAKRQYGDLKDALLEVIK